MTTNYDNVCVVIHEPEFVTVTITEEQLALLQTMCDVVRDDDDDENPCIPFAAALYDEITLEMKA